MDESGAPSLLMVATIGSTIRGFLLPYADHLRAEGWRVEAAANWGPNDAPLGEHFDAVHDLPLSRSVLDLNEIVRGVRALNSVVDGGYDLVHVHTPIAAFLARVAIRRLPPARRPAVAYTAHGFHFASGGNPVLNRAFLTAERVAGRWTDRLIVMNDEDEAAARRHRLVRSGALVRMPGIGIDTDWYARGALEPGAIARARAEFGIAEVAPLVVAVGEHSRRKRMGDVITALARMRNRDAVLVLAGDGRLRARNEALADELGIRDRVRFPGVVRDVRPLVAAADVLVLASSREGLARAIMEALALEVPVVASTARGNAELVTADSGFIVETGDTAGLAERLDWLVEHPDAGLAMGRRGRARMVEGYGLAHLIGLHDRLYAALLAERLDAQARVAV